MEVFWRAYIHTLGHLGTYFLQTTIVTVSNFLRSKSIAMLRLSIGYLTAESSSESQSGTIKNKKSTSSVHIMALNRGYTEEADRLLDYLVSSAGQLSVFLIWWVCHLVRKEVSLMPWRSSTFVAWYLLYTWWLSVFIFALPILTSWRLLNQDSNDPNK